MGEHVNQRMRAGERVDKENKNEERQQGEGAWSHNVEKRIKQGKLTFGIIPDVASAGVAGR